ncbi:MAG: hypothetical protein ACYTBW_00840 [Planctomycetota bacterium]|jgi:hypothetical protein
MSKRVNAYAVRAEQQQELHNRAIRQDSIDRNILLERIATALETIVSKLNE